MLVNNLINSVNPVYNNNKAYTVSINQDEFFNKLKISEF